MLPTFVIGLREGLEAALIVGIIAAFLRKQGRRDLLRWVFAGVGGAIGLCVAVGVALEVLSRNLPQRQQEGLETVIGALAVGMVTYMVVWMRRHSRELKGQLEGMAASALGGTSGAGRAMVAMAALAVLREGFETVVFLLAAFNESENTASAAGGALLGIVVAVALGYGIYRGGVRINLSKFFRATGLVLVLVAAGLVVNALRTAHEAGWLDVGQARTLDLTWLVSPGSVQSSLLTGMLGIQAHPVLIELVGWLVYLVPVGLYVAWPSGRAIPRRVVMRTLAVAGSAAAIVAVVFAVAVPDAPVHRPVTNAGATSAQLLATAGSGAIVRTQVRSPAGTQVSPAREVRLTHAGTGTRDGLAVDSYTATLPGATASALSATMSFARIAEFNGGRLPIGLRANDPSSAPVRYTDRTVLTVWVEPRSGRVVDLRWSERVDARVSDPNAGTLALADPVAKGSWSLPSAAAASALDAAHLQIDTLDRRTAFSAAAWCFGVAALLLLAAVAAMAFTERRGPRGHRVTNAAPELVHS